MTEPEPIDRKFLINAMCVEHGHVHSQADAILFLAKDKAVPATLRFYRKECVRLGADARQLLGIDLLIERVDRWQARNPSRLKVPDVDQGPIGEQIIRANER